MALITDSDKGTIYDTNINYDRVARSQITEKKILQLKKNQQNIERLVNDNINKKTVRNYKQELINPNIDQEKGTQNYIQKSMASLTEPITRNQTYLYPETAPPISSNPSYLEHTTTFTDNNITYELIEKIKKKSVLSPYSETTLDRMEETFRTDGVPKRGELKKWDFILGAEMKIIPKLTNDYDTKEEYRKMNKVIMKFVPYRTALNEAKYILNNIDFKNALHDSGVQSSTYGRGAIEKIRSIDKTIIGLNVLETRFMGNPIYLPINSITHLPIDSTNTPELVTNNIQYANPNQRVVRSRNIYWKLFGIEYLDPEDILNSNNPDNKEILMMKDLIYIVRDDVSVSAGTKGFGLSELEPALDGSETKRIMKSYDFKEISRSSFSSFGVIQALNSQISKAELQYLVDSMEVNGWCATAHQVTIDTFSLNSDARIMIEILDTMNRETGRDLDIPSPLLGYEHVQNYASLQQTLQSWKESVLDADRRRIREVIEKQLLEEILDTSLKRQGYCIKLNERFELQLYELDPFTKDIKYEIVVDQEINPIPQLEEDNKEQKDPNNKAPKPNNNNQQNKTFAFPPTKDNNNKDTENKEQNNKPNNINNKQNNINNKIDPNAELNPTRFIKRPVKPTLLYHDEITGKIEMVEVPPIKLSFEITDPNFSIFKDKGEIGIQLKNINAISVEKLLELVDMPDEIDDALKREAEQAERAKQQHDLMMMSGQNEMNTKSRLADEQIQNLRTERKAVGGASKYLEDDTDDKEKQKFDDDALKKKITDKKEKGRY